MRLLYQKPLKNVVSNQKGLSLIELMIALTLGLTLMAGVLQIFSANKKTFDVTQDLSSLQEKGQVALSLMAESIRMADHWGGVAGDNVEFGLTSLSVAPGGCSTHWVFQSVPSIMGFEGASSLGGIKTLPSSCIDANDYLGQSDLLVVRYADSRIMTPDIAIDNAKYKKHYFVRTNIGQSSYVFKGENSAHAMSKIVAGEAVYNMDYQASLYYLRPCSLKINKRCQDDIPTLMRLSLSGDRFVSQTLVEGIEQLKFSYGVDTNNDHRLDLYQNSDEVSDWQNVITVQINLIVRTLKKDSAIDDEGRAYLMGGGNTNKSYHYVVKEADKSYRRKLYSREVVLRNRL